MAGQKPAGRRTGGTQQGPVRPGSPTARPATASARQGSGKPKGQNGAGRGNPGNTPNKGGNGAAGGRSRTSGNSASAATAVRKPAARSSSATPRSAGSTAADQMAGRLLHAIGAPFRRLGRLPLIGRILSPFGSMGALPLATFILALYGLGASIYLTVAHYDTAVRLACADNGLINCELVTTSPESILFGIFPVAVLGLAFYVFMVAINSPWGWRQSWPPVRWARFGSVIVGMLFVLYLIYAEIDEIHAICLWCTSVHVATFLIFALLVFHTTFTWGKSPEQTGANR
jgi:uncharacterized membrane protein